jgi:succinoglycan biosynthesis protein ExoA
MTYPADEVRPFASLIMPIRNEGKVIEEVLTAVLTQDYPAERMEVLVVDGMSTDDTRAVIQRVAAAYPHIPVTVIDNPRQIVPCALNLGLKAAKGSIIIRVDGHCVASSTFVSACVDTLLTSGAENVGGRVLPIGAGVEAEAIAQATSSPFGVGGARFRYSDQDEWVDTVFPGTWRRELFDKIGGFDEELVRNQDDEFNYRLRAHGGKILLSSKIKLKYYSRGTVPKLWSQYFQYGYWKVRVLQKHPLQMRPRQFAPPLFVATLIGGVVLAPFVPLVAWLLALEVVLYCAANLLASFITARRSQLRYLAWLPLVYAVLHFSYGLGFLWGLVKFANRWRS